MRRREVLENRGPGSCQGPCCLAVWPWAVDLPSLNSDSLSVFRGDPRGAHCTGVGMCAHACWVCSPGLGPEQVLRERSSRGSCQRALTSAVAGTACFRSRASPTDGLPGDLLLRLTFKFFSPPVIKGVLRTGTGWLLRVSEGRLSEGRGEGLFS